MMYLIQIRKNLSIDDTDCEVTQLNEFKAVLDHKKGGETMLKSLAFYCDWLSPFRYLINDDTRLQAITKNFYNKAKHPFHKTEEWANAIELYEFLQRDPDRIMLRNLERYYERLTEKIDIFSRREAADIETEMENIEKIQSYTQKAMTLRNKIRELKDSIDNSRSNILGNVKKNLSFLEKRQLRNRALESNI